MPLSTLKTIEILKMQFVAWMVNITRELSFLITLEVVVTIDVVIVVLENLTLAATVVVVKLIAMIAGVQARIPISTTLTQTGTPIACLKSPISHNWVIKSGVIDHITENRGIMSSFTPTSYSKSVELADGSHILIQSIGTAATTPTLPLSYVFYLPRFPYNL